MTNVESKFALGETVRVAGTQLEVVVDMYGVQRGISEVQYLVEWVNSQDSVESRWYPESKLEKIK